MKPQRCLLEGVRRVIGKLPVEGPEQHEDVLQDLSKTTTPMPTTEEDRPRLACHSSSHLGKLQ